MSLTVRDAYELTVELARAVVDDQQHLWPDLHAQLETLTGSDWLALDNAARTHRYPEGTPVSGIRGWLGANLAEPTGFVAAVTSLHVDGRFRQRATRVLAERTGPVAVGAIAVRLLDHVPQVRSTAESALGRALTPDLAEGALDVVLSGRARLQGADGLRIVETHLRTLLGDAAYVARCMRANRRRVRRRGYEVAHISGLLPAESLRAVALTETDQLVLSWCSDWLLVVGRPEDFAELLGARSVEVRQVAVLRALDIDLTDGRLLEFTADRAPRVREAARFRAAKRGLSVDSWYRKQLVSDGPVGRRAAILDGLLFVGSAADLPVFRAALDDSSPRVRATAVRGYATWATSDQVLAAAPGMLLDSSPRVAAAAARVLVRAGAAGETAARAWESPQPGSRRAAWYLSRSTGGWDQVEADLRLALDPDPALAGLGSVQLVNWLHVHAASTWQSLGTAQQARIARSLSQWGGELGHRRTLAFHAGIRPLPEGPRPTDEPVPTPRVPWWRRR